MSIFDLQLETERLILRPPRAEDFDDFLRFCSDPEVMQHLGGVQAPSQAWRSFSCLVGSWHLYGFSMFSVIEKSSGEWVGRMGPWQPLDWPGTEVGWSIRRESWGKGYAPEAAVASMDWAFDTLGWEEIIHHRCGQRKLQGGRAQARQLAAAYGRAAAAARRQADRDLGPVTAAVAAASGHAAVMLHPRLANAMG